MVKAKHPLSSARARLLSLLGARLAAMGGSTPPRVRHPQGFDTPKGRKPGRLGAVGRPRHRLECSSQPPQKLPISPCLAIQATKTGEMTNWMNNAFESKMKVPFYGKHPHEMNR